VALPCITSFCFAGAGFKPYLRNAAHVELGWFTARNARELNVADPVYLELFARVDAMQRGRH